MPAGHDAAALKAAERGAETEREIGLLKSQLGELQGGWDAKVREAADAVKKRKLAERRVAELQHELKCSQTEVAQLKGAPTPPPAPAPSPLVKPTRGK